jgi:DNA recombination protein RmuC
MAKKYLPYLHHSIQLFKCNIVHMEILYLFIGLLIGAFASFIYVKNKFLTVSNGQAEAEKQAAVLNNTIKSLQDEKIEKQQQIVELQKEILKVSNDYSSVKRENQLVLEKFGQQEQDLIKTQERLKVDFENLANKILEEKTQKFTDQNRTSLDIILQPFKERIKDFEDKVQKVYDTESSERNKLKGEIGQLISLNQKMHQETQNLTKALKGDNKTQGNWGEFILESILEKSGLVKDREYKTQESHTMEDGRRLQPDVIITLPEGKHLVIDSKVSLVGFEKAVNADNDEERLRCVKEHVISVRNHVKQLSEKKYQQLYGIKSLDFVLLFIPVEPAFALAVQNDSQLFHDSFEKNIVIVSPTTLLATLRTIANIWRNENQSRNAFEIAKKAGDLYDKFVGFSEDLIELGKQLDKSKLTYTETMKKLTEGRGNLVKKVEELKVMGASTNKSISPALLNRSEDES